MSQGVVIAAAVEGVIDEAVVRKLIVQAGAVPGTVCGKQGKGYLRRKIAGYNSAARRTPWLILVYLDQDYDCAPALCNEWLPSPAHHLCFRIAVPEVEAWLMADFMRIASFLSIHRTRVSSTPESLADPKAEMVELSRHSRRRDIREDMIPRRRSHRRVGPGYSARLIEYVGKRWRPDVAAEHSDSLKRALRCIRRLSTQKH